ncbi:MAG: mechanosensitive ion channel family protein [Candidatus Micrarchaeota archaeon]
MADIPFLDIVIFGNELWQYALSLLIVLASVVLAKIAYYVIRHYIKALTAKTKTKLDDILVEVMEGPLLALIIILGVSYARAPLTLQADIDGMITAFVGVLLTLDVAWFLSKLSDGVIRNYVTPLADKSKSKLDDQLVPIVKNGVRIILFTLAFLSILSNFGYDITAVLGGLGIAGIAIAMAANHSLSHIIGGATIFADRPFEVGDSVKIGGTFGKVEEVGMRSTRIRTFDGIFVTIPNADVANSVVENYSKTTRRRITLNIGIEYGTAPKKIEEAKRIVKKIVKETDGLDHKEVNIYFMQFGDSSLNLVGHYYLVDIDKLFVVQDIVNTRVNEEFAKARIGFAFPSRTIYMKKG